jgi:penicillin-binding protein 1C
VFGAAASHVVADILADRGARAPTFGLENALATRVWSAAKTGTSKDMRDNWCVGFTSRYTVGVWVGNFSGAPMHDVSGVTGAAPIWRDVVHRLHRDVASTPPVPPRDVERSTVAFDPPVESDRAEWFVRGTAMARVRAVVDDDAVTADDPLSRARDDRRARPRHPAQAPAHGVRRVRDAGRRLVVARRRPLDERGARALWSPAPGKHVLSLVDARGLAVSTVAFEVRGAP